MNTRLEAVLRSIAYAPKSVADIIESPTSLNGLKPTYIPKIIDSLAMLGFIRLMSGKYQITPEGTDELREIDGDKGNPTPAKQFTNALMPAMTADYARSVMRMQAARPGADNHKRFSSRGV